MRVGIAGVSLERCFGGEWRLADELRACALAAEGTGGCGVIVVADVVRLRLDFATRFRKAVARELGIGTEQVCVAATQNHSAFEPLDQDRLEEAFVAAAREAWNSRTDAEMAGIAVRPQPPLNHCRRMRLAELGAFTCWYGHVEAKEGRADVSYLVHLAKEALARGELEVPRSTLVPPSERLLSPQAEKHLLRESDDPLVQGLFFRKPAGRPIGAILRFSAHPAVAGGKSEGFRSGDFPAYARRRLEKTFGGNALYLAGPCGDTVPLIEEKSLAFSERLGKDLAALALEALRDASWHGGEVASATTLVELNLRKDLPRELSAARAEMAALESRIRELAARRDLPGVKRAQERRETLRYWCNETLCRWMPLPREKICGASAEYPLFAMRLGEHGILGLPGEPYAAYSAKIRASGGGDKLLIGEQCNAGFGYIPTAEEFAHGGYGPSASLFDERVEGDLLAGARRGLEAVGLTTT